MQLGYSSLIIVIIVRGIGWSVTDTALVAFLDNGESFCLAFSGRGSTHGFSVEFSVGRRMSQ